MCKDKNNVYGCNLDIELLKEKVMNSEMDSVIKSAVVLTLNAYMEHERDKHLHVAHYERSPERQDSRNGYYERELTMKIGKVPLKVPRTRSGEFSTTVFEKYARCDQAFVLSMLEMVVQWGFHTKSEQYRQAALWRISLQIICFILD